MVEVELFNSTDTPSHLSLTANSETLSRKNLFLLLKIRAALIHV